MPYIKNAIDEALSEYEKQGEKLVILDGATLIEHGYNEKMDMMVLVWIKLPIQIQRLKERDRLTQSEAVNRINSQWSLEKKRDYANLIIDNNGNLINTKEQVDDLIDFLKLYEN